MSGPVMSAGKIIASARTASIDGRGRFGPLLLAAAFALLSIHRAAAAVTIDGDQQAMTVTVEEVTRQEVTDEIARRFGFSVSGAVADDAPLNGRFRGDLGDVLGAILTANNFLIIYEGGRPARLLLSDRGQGGAEPIDPAMRSLQPNAGLAPGEGGYDGQGLGDQGLGGEGQYVDPAMDGVPLEGEPPPEPQL